MNRAAPPGFRVAHRACSVPGPMAEFLADCPEVRTAKQRTLDLDARERRTAAVTDAVLKARLRKRHIAQARALCEACPMLQACRRSAFDDDVIGVPGMLAGMTREERFVFAGRR